MFRSNVESSGNTGADRSAVPRVTQRHTLSATVYNVHITQTVAGGIALRETSGRSHGPHLSSRDFCMAALQGTVTISDRGRLSTYNLMGPRLGSQTNCAPYFSSMMAKGGADARMVRGLERAAFIRTDAPFGLGVNNMRIVPMRSVAVDPTVIRIGSLLYLPAFDGRRITMPDGGTMVHDGYFIAADTGPSIQGRRIDIFAGLSDQRWQIASFHNRSLDVQVVRNPARRAMLMAMHAQ